METVVFSYRLCLGDEELHVGFFIVALQRMLSKKIAFMDKNLQALSVCNAVRQKKLCYTNTIALYVMFLSFVLLVWCSNRYSK